MAKNEKPTPVDYSKLSQEELAKLAETQAGKISELEKENSTLKKENEEALALNQELQKKVEEAGLTGPALPEVKHEKKTYQIVIPKFRLKGETITAEELQKRPELVKQLVKEESGVLKLKED